MESSWAKDYAASRLRKDRKLDILAFEAFRGQRHKLMSVPEDAIGAPSVLRIGSASHDSLPAIFELFEGNKTEIGEKSQGSVRTASKLYASKWKARAVDRIQTKNDGSSSGDGFISGTLHEHAEVIRARAQRKHLLEEKNRDKKEKAEKEALLRHFSEHEDTSQGDQPSRYPKMNKVSDCPVPRGKSSLETRHHPSAGSKRQSRDSVPGETPRVSTSAKRRRVSLTGCDVRTSSTRSAHGAEVKAQNDTSIRLDLEGRGRRTRPKIPVGKPVDRNQSAQFLPLGAQDALRDHDRSVSGDVDIDEDEAAVTGHSKTIPLSDYSHPLTGTDAEFEELLSRLKLFKARSGRTVVCDGEDAALRGWTNAVRQSNSMGKLSHSRRRALERIGFEWKQLDVDRLKRFHRHVEGFASEIRIRGRLDFSEGGHGAWFQRTKKAYLSECMHSKKRAIVEKCPSFLLLLPVDNPGQLPQSTCYRPGEFDEYLFGTTPKRRMDDAENGHVEAALHPVRTHGEGRSAAATVGDCQEALSDSCSGDCGGLRDDWADFPLWRNR